MSFLNFPNAWLILVLSLFTSLSRVHMQNLCNHADEIKTWDILHGSCDNCSTGFTGCAGRVFHEKETG